MTHRYSYFYPRSPCGERRWLRCWQLAAQDISIHALLAESDRLSFRFSYAHSQFLSTLSLRRATSKKSLPTCFIKHFYPRSPCGERPFITTITICIASFLSTLSLRRATYDGLIASANFCRFLSTLSLRRATGFGAGSWPRRIFLSTLSLRRATVCLYRLPLITLPISIHALLAESDQQ